MGPTFRRAFSRIGAMATVLVAVVLTYPAVAQPASRYDSTAHPSRSMAVVRGHVRTLGGQPVAGAPVAFQMAPSGKVHCPRCTRVRQVETRTDGSYSIALPDGGYTAECEVLGPCGAQGTSGGGVRLDVGPGRTLDFIVCPSYADLPRCLNG